MRRLLLLTVLLLAVPTLPAHAGGGCHDPSLSDRVTNTVALSGNCYSPTIARVQVGEIVTFVNKDGMVHRLDAPARWGLEGDMMPGDRAAFRFSSSGIYPYACYIHPSMVGAVVVGDGATVEASSLQVRPVPLSKADKAAAEADRAAVLPGTSGSSGDESGAGGSGDQTANDSVAAATSADAPAAEQTSAFLSSGVVGALIVVLAGAAALALILTAMVLRRRRAIASP